MAITFGIAPNPHWVVIDDFSKLPPGAAIYTFDSANKSIEKPAYQAPNINIPFTNPIVGFANGTFPAIYWKFDDSLDPPDLYYIQVWDKVKGPNNVNGAVMLWDFDGLTGSNASGGGGTITTNLDLENLVVNGEFYWNVGNLPIAPATSVPALVTLAPSNHDGFCGVALDPANQAPPSPDIIFAKSSTLSNDSIKFTDFPLGSTDLIPNQPTPKKYVNYACTSGGAETYKVIQFPIVKGLQNLNNLSISIAMWNQYTSGNSNITLQLRQFFGNGTNGPSSDVVTPLGSLSFSGTDWTKTEFLDVIVPGIGFGGATLGNCGNDALFLQINIPTGVTTDFNFILPAIYIGDSISETDFHTQDFVDSIVHSPRTGDTRTSINSFAPYGWVPANDGTIGSATSGATARSNIDTFPLYDLIWNAIPDSLAPVTGGRGASSIADFGNNKPMALTRNLGRVMAGALPVAASQSFTRNVNNLDVTSSSGFYTGMAVTVSGGGLPTPLVAGTIYYAIIVSSTKIALATTTANALAGTVLPLTGAGTGTITSLNVETLGSYIGEERHLQAGNEVGIHSHTASFSYQAQSNSAGGTPTIGSDAGGTVQNVTVNNSAQNVPMNIMQPTVYMNVFIKL